MEIRIANYVTASHLLGREPNQWHAIVLLDSDKHATDFVRSHTRSYLILRFDDIEAHHPNRYAPTERQVAQSPEFSRGKDKLLVSCRAGQGRSAALAYVIGCRERGAIEAINILDPTRHRPNRLIISLGDALLDARGVREHFERWQRTYAHVKLSDHYDEIEKELDTLEAQGATNRICVP